MLLVGTLTFVLTPSYRTSPLSFAGNETLLISLIFWSLSGCIHPFVVNRKSLAVTILEKHPGISKRDSWKSERSSGEKEKRKENKCKLLI